MSETVVPRRVVRVRLRAGASSYDIAVGAGTLESLGERARRVLGDGARRAALASNPKVFALYGDEAARSLRDSGFQVSPFLAGDGERHKTLRTWARLLDFLSGERFERSDAIVALGGGVVGDLAGFAAATYLRGLAFIQVPTTLLAQIDASTGGKTGVNMPTGKNLVGAFHQPRHVLIDTVTLRTLPPRELTAGWCEAIKHGAVGSRPLFEKTIRFLRRARRGEDGNYSGAGDLGALVAAHVRFKAGIVSGDEREDLGRTDALSRRVLNFGHTTAHALEAVTNFRRFRHGEAVGYGMLVAGEISKGLGMLDDSELESLREAVRLTGRLPPAADLDPARIIASLARDKKRVGGSLKWVLLERLGRAAIVDGREIAPRLVRASLRAVLREIP